MSATLAMLAAAPTGPDCSPGSQGILSGGLASVVPGVPVLASGACLATGQSVGDVTGQIGQALGGAIKAVTTFWVTVPAPDVADANNAITGTASWLNDRLWFYAAIFAVLGIAWQGARIAWNQRGQDVGELIKSLVRFVLIMGMGAAVVQLAVVAGDEFSSWIIDLAGGQSLGDNLTAMMTDQTGLGALGTIGAIILLGLAFIVAICQVVLMIVRNGVLVVLVGAWLLPASVAMVEDGRGWLNKHTGWIIGFLLYKPAASIVYAAGFSLIGTPTNETDAVIAIISGLALMITAVFALPAMIRAAVSLTEPVASGKGFGATAAGATALVVASAR